MTTVAELEITNDLQNLRDLAGARGWEIKPVDQDSFLLGLPARDKSTYWLKCHHDRFPATPPAWHWSNSDGTELDQFRDMPREYGGFFHSNGVICAPWNRLAYKNVFDRGPHTDWTIGDWRSNSYTQECKSLTAMALRIYVELQKPAYAGRKAA